MKTKIEKILEKFDFVMWDRFCTSGMEVTVFGWIERKDAYKDFVVFYFVGNELDSYMTSSKKYSLILYKMINDGNGRGHINCKRVEDSFKINNSIKLSS